MQSLLWAFPSRARERGKNHILLILNSFPDSGWEWEFEALPQIRIYWRQSLLWAFPGRARERGKNHILLILKSWTS